MIGFNGKELRKGFILPWGSVLFFMLLALNNTLSLWPWARTHTFQIVNSGLAIIILISMAIGRPFTLQYAREEVPPEKWSHPMFLKINWILTSAWAVLMIVMAIPSYLLTEEAIQASWFFNYGFSIICIVLGLCCNRWVPALLKRKQSK
jgi:small-conductance mechanosensitive channel